MDSYVHDHNFNIRLCKAVKKHPLIYNTDLKDYMNREAKERAWIEVGLEMNCDPKILQKKFQNIRTILVRKLRQIRNRESVNRNYYLYPYIKFIIPYLKSPYNTVSFTKSENKETSSEDEANDEYLYEPYSDHSMEEGNVLEDTDGNENPVYYEEDELAIEMIKPELNNIAHISDEDEVAIEDDIEQNEISLNNELKQKRSKLTTSYAPSSTAAHSKSKRLKVDDKTDDFDENPTTFKQEQKENYVNSTVNKELPQITSSHTLSSSSTNHAKRKRPTEVADTANPTKQFLLSLLPDLGEMTSSQLRHFKTKALKKKWKNFRTIFVRKIRDLKYGKYADKPHYLYHHLEFLLPHLKKSYDEPGEPVKRPALKDKDLNDAEEAGDAVDETHSNHSMEEDNILQESDDNTDPIYYDEGDDAINITTPAKKTKRPYSSEEDDDEEQKKPRPNSSLNQKRPKRSEVNDTSNPKKHFLLSLLPDLDEMSSAQMRQFKVKVILLVEDILKDTST